MIRSFNEFSQSTNEGFWDWLTGKEEEGEEKQKGRPADPGVQDETLEEFYETLEDFADSNQSVEAQTYGNMKYSKMVENIQAALSFLGYSLPKHGVDGFFGPETASAVLKFNADTLTETDSEA
jgi:peptidoglycan hydrolase-like protein with peptidoglycan-binding domain